MLTVILSVLIGVSVLAILGAMLYYRALENPEFAKKIFRSPRSQAVFAASRERYRKRKSSARISMLISHIMTEAKIHKSRRSSPDTCRTRLGELLVEYRRALEEAGVSNIEQDIQTMQELWHSILNEDDDDMGNGGSNLRPIPIGI